jgi:hypothetical protein
MACPEQDERREGDGIRFDPRRVAAYLRGLAVHERTVPLDELEAAQRAGD